MNNSKTTNILLIILIVLLVGFGIWIATKKETTSAPQSIPHVSSDSNNNTYTYTNHGFSIELPKWYIPKEEQAEGGPATMITLPQGNMSYITDVSHWEKYVIPEYTFVRDEKIGETIFKTYRYGGVTMYWYKKGNIGYEYSGDIQQLQTFKYVGWPQILGNTEDLVSFSIKPGQEIKGSFTEMEYTGSIKGGYFFEGNILVNVLDANKHLLRTGHASAGSDWMNAGPVSFQGFLNLSGLPKGNAYIEIKNDNASGLSQNDKSIFIPIVIK